MPSEPVPSPSSAPPPSPQAPASDFQNLGPLEAPPGYVSPEPDANIDASADGAGVPSFADTMPDDPALAELSPSGKAFVSEGGEDDPTVPPATVAAKVAPASTATPEPKVADEPKADASAEVKPADPVPAEPAKPAVFDPTTWASFDDVKVEAVPEAARPYIMRARELAQTQIDATVAGVEAVKSDLNTLIGTLKSQGADGIGERSKLVLDLMAANRELTTTNTTMVWRAFTDAHPGYHDLPVEARTAFAGMLSKGAMGIFPGNDPVEKLAGIYRYVCGQHGITVPAKGVVEPPVVVVAPEPSTPPAAAKPGSDASKAALVTDGRSASRQPAKPAISDLRPRDILSQHEHLLRG